MTEPATMCPLVAIISSGYHHNPIMHLTQDPPRPSITSIPPSMRTSLPLQAFRVIPKIIFLVTHKEIFRVTHQVTLHQLYRDTHQIRQTPTTITRLIPRPLNIPSPPMLAAPVSLVSSQLSLVFSMGSLVLVMDTPVTQIMVTYPIIITITSLHCSQVFPITNSSFTSLTSSQQS